MHHRAHYVKTRHPQNRKYITYRNAARGGLSQDRATATATGNMQKKIDSEICEWTDRQTDILITVLRTPPEGEVSEVISSS